MEMFLYVTNKSDGACSLGILLVDLAGILVCVLLGSLFDDQPTDAGQLLDHVVLITRLREELGTRALSLLWFR